MQAHSLIPFRSSNTTCLLLLLLLMRRSWHDGQLPTRYAYLSGALCGVTEGVAFAPFQVIKVRGMAGMQSSCGHRDSLGAWQGWQRSRGCYSHSLRAVR
jgi:hypothetical protein